VRSECSTFQASNRKSINQRRPKSQINELSGFYEAQLPSGAIPSTGGTFTFTGAGGANVGPFTAAVTFPNPLLTWTNQSAAASITRSQGVQVNWTGGATESYVIISGNSTGSSGVYGGFTCYAPQSALQFTVPPYVTGTLPAGTGTLSVENNANFGKFTATGIDYGVAFGITATSVNATYQ
jgi:hypothetical protein